MNKKLRKPPVTGQIDAWIKQGDTNNTGAKASVTQVTGNPEPQVIEIPKASTRKPQGPGIVERADGSFRRRLVVYVDPQRALQLKAHSVIQGRDMSDVIDELLEGWIASQ